MTLAAAILAKSAPYENRLVGARISKIHSITAGKMAVLIQAHAPKLRSFLGGAERDSIIYLCAVMYQESRFDPEAFNMNLKAPRDAALIARSVLGIGPWPPAIDQGDFGCAQFSFRYAKLRSEFKGLTSELILAKLFDPAWAVPAMATQYASLLDVATRKYPKLNPRDAAAGIFNRGQMGFACGYAWKFSEPFPPSATPQHIAKAPDYWKGAERHFTHIQKHRLWFQQHLN